MQSTDAKKPTGDGNPTAGSTDNAIVPRPACTGNSPLSLAYTAINYAMLRFWCATPSRWLRRTIRTKAKAPVRRNTFSEAVAAPTEKRGFVTPNLWSWCACTASLFWSVVGVIRKDARTASDVFLTTTLHPTRVETLTVALVPPEGAKTMCPSPMASRSAAPTTTPTTSEQQAFAVLQATSDAAMAKLYLSRGNIPAARRKAVQLLKALQGLSKFERAQATTSASPCTGCIQNFALPSGPLDFFDAQVVRGYIELRTACTERAGAAKPCLKGGAQ